MTRQRRQVEAFHMLQRARQSKGIARLTMASANIGMLAAALELFKSCGGTRESAEISVQMVFGRREPAMPWESLGVLGNMILALAETLQLDAEAAELATFEAGKRRLG